MSDAAERAERLDVALLIWNNGRTGFAVCSPEVAAFFNSASDDDAALFAACVELEAEVRANEWDALERLVALLNDPARHGMRAVFDGLTNEQAYEGFSALSQVGWLTQPPSDQG